MTLIIHQSTIGSSSLIVNISVHEHFLVKWGRVTTYRVELLNKVKTYGRTLKFLRGSITSYVLFGLFQREGIKVIG